MSLDDWRMYSKKHFLNLIAQTSSCPQGFEPESARGSWIYDRQGTAYLDLISGFSVSNLGHSHPAIIDAITNQASRYIHTNVYGEHIQSAQMDLATRLRSLLPSGLDHFYFLNSGSETVDAAIKLSRKFTGKWEIVVLKSAYHGSTIAAESLRSDEQHKAPFRPLLQGIRWMEANRLADLDQITGQTAMVLIECVQAEAGVIALEDDFLQALRNKCFESGALLAIDEIQTGLGRTGNWFSFQKHQLVPDIVLLGKALGGGLPLSALVSSGPILQCFTENPALSYISTFGGNPVCCAAGLAHLECLMQQDILQGVPERSHLIADRIQSDRIQDRRIQGLLAAIELENESQVSALVNEAYEKKILIEGFLFDRKSFRMAPPLNIALDDLENACDVISSILKSW